MSALRRFVKPFGANDTSREAQAGASSLVSPEDLYGCYRLLLGREPDPDGLEYWRSAVGTLQVSELVGAFFDSREFHLSTLYRRILDSAEVPSVNAQSAALRVDLTDRVQYVDPGDEFVGQTIADTGVYEPHLSRAIAESLDPGDTFLDIGANIGWFSVLAATLVGPSGRVVALEAEPSNVELIIRSSQASDLHNVVALPVAASSDVGTLLLQHLGGSNAAVYFAEESVAPGDRWVTAVPLDGLSSLVERVDVMKIDVEGAELLVLRGAQGLVRKFEPTIFLEFSPGMLSRFAGSGTEELQEWVHANSYEVSIVTYEGALLDIPTLEDAKEYCRNNSYKHIEIRLVPIRDRLRAPFDVSTPAT